MRELSTWKIPLVIEPQSILWVLDFLRERMIVGNIYSQSSEKVMKELFKYNYIVMRANNESKF